MLKELEESQTTASKFKKYQSEIIAVSQSKSQSKLIFSKPRYTNVRVKRSNSISPNHLSKKAIDYSKKLIIEKNDKLNKSDEKPTQKKSIHYSKYLYVFQDSDTLFNRHYSKERKVAQTNVIKNYLSNTNNKETENDYIYHSTNADGDLGNFGPTLLNTK